MSKFDRFFCVVAVLGVLFSMPRASYAQETTGGLQGTVKDPSGAVVPGAKVTVTGTALVGSKETDTDSSGYYRFANLPATNYTITVTAKGFATIKRELVLEVGHLPTVDFALEVGSGANLGINSNADMAKLKPEAILDWATDKVDRRADACLISCTAIKSAPVIARLPIRWRRDLMFGGELTGVEKPQHLVEVTTARHRVGQH